jgi:hypothetical protein
MTYMFHLTPEGSETRFRFRVGKIRSKKQREIWPAFAPAFQEIGRQLVQGLTALVEQEAETREPDANTAGASRSP